MFQKVLIAEDHESTSMSIRMTLEVLGIFNTLYVYYCDDALLQLRRAISDNEPFDLLITDLSFEPDHREQSLSGGAALIEAAHVLQPHLKTLVFSLESRPEVINKLFEHGGIDAYVRKARGDAHELQNAIARIAENRKYKPIGLRQALQQKNTHAFTELDIAIVRLLAQGKKQFELPALLELSKIRPSSLSSIEKRLNLMKQSLDFSKNEQLVVFCRDMGLI